MTRRSLMGSAMFGAVALGIAGLAAAAGYFAIARDDDDDEDEGREANERDEKTNAPPPNAPMPQPQNGAPQ